jgi:hypothetical protein
MMADDFVIAGQITTGHSKLADLTPEKVTTAIDAINQILPVQIVCIGWREVPELYHALTGPSRVTEQVFIWYPLLSDYPGLDPSELVINYRGQRAGGWADFPEGDEVHESFTFGCPNNPAVRAKTLESLESLLTSYVFDGVFLDKLRFPSPANGFDDMLSCFCPHCRAKAEAQGLDLERVRRVLLDLSTAGSGKTVPLNTAAPGWLADLLSERTVLRQFLDFRAASITGLVREVHELATGLGRAVALDTFSPGIAPLVGQDYASLARYADWVKPMSYRFTKAPASLRLEVPSLLRGMAALLGADLDTAVAWAGVHVPGIAGVDPMRYEDGCAPPTLFAVETAEAVAALSPVPVYLGLETVYWPGLTEVSADDVAAMTRAGRDAGAGGACLSWDLLHTPLEYIKVLKEAL